jgi:hypothetical protein
LVVPEQELEPEFAWAILVASGSGLGMSRRLWMGEEMPPPALH